MFRVLTYMVDKEENLVYNIGIEKKNNSSLCAPAHWGLARRQFRAAERKISFRIANAILPEIYLLRRREKEERGKKKKKIILIIYNII